MEDDTFNNAPFLGMVRGGYGNRTMVFKGAAGARNRPLSGKLVTLEAGITECHVNGADER
jgi:hypothetical protein